METKVNIGGKVKALRKGRGWTQQELANRAGVSMQTISNVEIGRHAPDFETVGKIAGALGVSLDDLIR